jgi:hypothetical protein
MPKAVEDALRKAARKMVKGGKIKKGKNKSLEAAKNKFVFGTMTNMAKRGEIPKFGAMK